MDLIPACVSFPLYCSAQLPASDREGGQLPSPLLAAGTENQPGPALPSLRVPRWTTGQVQTSGLSLPTRTPGCGHCRSPWLNTWVPRPPPEGTRLGTCTLNPATQEAQMTSDPCPAMGGTGCFLGVQWPHTVPSSRVGSPCTFL